MINYIKIFFDNIRYLGRYNLKEIYRTKDLILLDINKGNKIITDNLPYEIYDSVNKKELILPNIMTVCETIDEIIYNKKSISRFGDGEFITMFGDIGLNKTYFNTEISNLLQDRLKEVLNSNNENHLVCLWDFFGSLTKFCDSAKGTARVYMPELRKKLEKYIRRNYKYGNAFISRPYLPYEDYEKSKEIFDKIKKIWENRDIIIIEGEYSRLGVGNNLFEGAKSIKRILCPAENAFAVYDKILDYSKQADKNCLILIALGMSASILAYDLSNLGYQAIDIGHIDVEYECFLNKSKDYNVVKNKYVNDIGKRHCGVCKNTKYLKEIVKIIK